MSERRRLPRTDEVWTSEQRENFRAWLAAPGPLMGGWPDVEDPWQGVR